KQKRDLFNDLDFFLRNNSPEYSKSYSFTDYTGTAGLILFSLSALVFFSMLIHLLNRILVEKDRTKFVKLKHDTAYALILETNTNKDTNSILPKTLMKLNGKTIAESVVDALKIDEIDKIGIVIDPMNKKLFKRIFKERVSLIEQKESAGPVYSLICAQEWIGEMNGDLLIIPDNVPFITKDVIIKLIREHRRAGNICTILAAPFNKNILPYGIIGRNTVNRVSGIFEAKDLTEDDKKNIEVNTSFYCFKYKHLSGILKKCGTGKEVHDLILPDIINLMIEMKIKVEAIPIKVLKPVYGVNTQEEFKNEGKI
ncbi:MAG: NTP transferase domain-containing protein, partial [Candidatus Delongbacteria bacterium]|nr:NTP transferase domain-containing protein [Candidatus Delongbacteria bacterium]MCG2761064.1 NTP transferase domain-containing protein [Candidatus Delongbacteria bacterium]